MKSIRIYCVCIILVMCIALKDCSPVPHEKSGKGRADVHAKAVHAPTGKAAGTSDKMEISSGKPAARCFGLDLIGALWPWGDDSYYDSYYYDDETMPDKRKLGRSETAPKNHRSKSKKAN